MGTDLTVSLKSFSYKKGMPAVDSEHGGGFVFDCRCLQNPGREEKFKKLSGKDPSVVAYLEALPEVESFRKNIFALVEQAIEVYKKRGFTSLSVAFGCTGGQHRSVYFVELLAKHLKKLGVNLVVEHREEKSWV